MLNFNFNAQDYEEDKVFEILPVGDYRVRIKSATEGVSKSSGNPMVTLVFEVSGRNNILYHYLPVSGDTKKDSQRFGEFWSCFGIPMGTMDTAQYVGKIGAVRTKVEKYEGEDAAKVHYLINKKKQATLPAWVEPTNSSSPQNTPPQNYYGTPEPPQNSVPFDASTLI